MTAHTEARDPLLIRTTASHDDAWTSLVEFLSVGDEFGFRPYVTFVEDEEWFGKTDADVAHILRRGHGAIAFVADDVTLTEGERPVLVLDLAEGREPFRCVASELWAIENNLSIANMDWKDFTRDLAPDGVYRGPR